MITNVEAVTKSSKNKKVPKNYVWYQLLTDEKLFSKCKKVNEIALRFLNRSFNEAIVEVEVPNLKEI